MFDSFFSGDGFISIFFLLFIVAFVAILGMILVTFVRELSQRNRNNHSPRLTVEATVVAKRQSSPPTAAAMSCTPPPPPGISPPSRWKAATAWSCR